MGLPVWGHPGFVGALWGRMRASWRQFGRLGAVSLCGLLRGAYAVAGGSGGLGWDAGACERVGAAVRLCGVAGGAAEADWPEVCGACWCDRCWECFAACAGRWTGRAAAQPEVGSARPGQRPGVAAKKSSNAASARRLCVSHILISAVGVHDAGHVWGAFWCIILVQAPCRVQTGSAHYRCWLLCSHLAWLRQLKGHPDFLEAGIPRLGKNRRREARCWAQ